MTSYMHYIADEHWTPLQPAWMLIDNGELQSLTLHHVMETIPEQDAENRFKDFCSKVAYNGKIEVYGYQLSELCHYFEKETPIVKPILISGKKNYIDMALMTDWLKKYGFKINKRTLHTKIEYLIEAQRIMQ